MMARVRPVRLPKWGLEMTEGTILAWHAEEGATLAAGADLVDIETEKIVNTLDLEAGGVLRRRVAAPGETLPVGALIAVVADPEASEAEVEAVLTGGEAPTPRPEGEEGDAAARADSGASERSQEDAAGAPTPGTEPRAADLPARNATAYASPLARRRADALGVDLAAVAGTGRKGRISQGDVEAAARRLGLADGRGTAPAPAPSAMGEASGGPLAEAAREGRGRTDGRTRGAGDRPDSTPDADLAERNAAAHASPHARRRADRLGLDLAMVAGTGRNGRISLADVEAAAAAAGLAPAPGGGPARPAGETGASAGDGAGPSRGADAPEAAEAAVRSEAEAPAGARAADTAAGPDTRRAGTPVADNAAHGPRAASGGTFVPFSALRRSIAAKVSAAQREVPQFRVETDVRMDELLSLRAGLNARLAEDARISVTDMIVKAAAGALTAYPDVNVHVRADGVIRHATVDVAVAVAIEGGLVAPVIRDAARRPLAAIARDGARLVAAARARALAAEDLAGATFTVSNLGMRGIRRFDAIVDPPQAAILAVGAVRRAPVEGPDGALTFESRTALTLTADHRAVDGDLAARFLEAIRERLEDPLGLLL